MNSWNGKEETKKKTRSLVGGFIDEEHIYRNID
jgi:hypothetical protein